jgi:hypothetical protein
MGSTVGGGWGVPVREGSATQRHPLERFDPLLRALLSWDLVSLTNDDGAATWQLTPDAQQRLAELARPRSQPPENVVHLGGRCEECRSRRSLRLSGGRLLCDDCRRHEDP